ncbi:MAG TPA: CPBP family intramembrane glutamic endopeptidase [Patescibacteria group bacterium]|nr:CPBP family intramembrane glutamic endopeptidase [Patescibacteria group bacterium]
MAKKNKPEDGLKILKNIKKRDKKIITGWGPTSAILVTLGVYFGSQILAGYLVIQYLFMLGNTSKEINNILDDSVIVRFCLMVLIGFISIGLLWAFLRKRKISWPEIGLKKPTSNNLFYSLPAYAIYFVILVMAFALIKSFVPGIDTGQKQQIGFDNAVGPIALSFVFISIVIIPAVVEEITVRGFLYGGLKNKLPIVASALLTSGIFAVAHLQLGSGENPLWIAAVDTFILSMVLIWLREKTGNIWAGVVVHLMKNSLAFISLFIIKAT